MNHYPKLYIDYIYMYIIRFINNFFKYIQFSKYSFFIHDLDFRYVNKLC